MLSNSRIPHADIKSTPEFAEGYSSSGGCYNVAFAVKPFDQSNKFGARRYRLNPRRMALATTWPNDTGTAFPSCRMFSDHELPNS